MTRYAGLDLSPDGSAITIWEDGTLENFLLFSKVQKWEKKFPNHFVTVPKVTRGNEQSRIERLEYVSGEVLDFILSNDVEYVCLEDYAYGKSNGSEYQIAELGGQIRLGLWRHCKVRTHDPRSLKLYWTGSGNASKLDMVISKNTQLCQVVRELNNVTEFLINDYSNKYKEKKPTKPTGHPLEGLVDSMALAWLIYDEIKFRQGEFVLSEQKEEVIRVFNRVTKNIPNCLIDRPFLTKGK